MTVCINHGVCTNHGVCAPHLSRENSPRRLRDCLKSALMR